MDFVHNGNVILQPFSIGKMYRSDWDRIRFQAERELIKVFAHELPAKEVLLTNIKMNTSYAKSY